MLPNRRLWRSIPPSLTLLAVRTGIVTVAAALIILIPIVILKWGPEWLASPGLAAKDHATEVSSSRTSLITFCAGIVAAVGIFFTARTFRLSREGQITERFTAAIQQLGDDKIEVRLGAIYALERLAKDSSVDGRSIMEILTAYVRERARHRPTESPEEGLSDQGGQAEPSVGLRTDIQAALTVVGRRNLRREDPADPFVVELSFADLRRVKLPDLNLTRANLAGALLEGSNLARANLKGANLTGAHLRASNLAGAELANADLSGADLENANLASADLQDARCRFADLHGCMLRDANLVKCNFFKANLSDAVFWNADLREASVWNARLDGADLSGALLQDTRYNEATSWPAGFDAISAGGVRGAGNARGE